MPICCVTLIPRHCGVLICTPHSSGFVRAALGLPPILGGFPVSEALHMGILRQPPVTGLWDSLFGGLPLFSGGDPSIRMVKRVPARYPAKKQRGVGPRWPMIHSPDIGLPAFQKELNRLPEIHCLLH